MVDKVTKKIESLSLREIEVLGRIAQGLSNQEICETLCVTRATLVTHINNIGTKLGMWQGKDNPNSVRRVQMTLFYLDNKRQILSNYNRMKRADKLRQELKELQYISKLAKQRGEHNERI